MREELFGVTRESDGWRWNVVGGRDVGGEGFPDGGLKPRTIKRRCSSGTSRQEVGRTSGVLLLPPSNVRLKSPTAFTNFCAYLWLYSERIIRSAIRFKPVSSGQTSPLMIWARARTSPLSKRDCTSLRWDTPSSNSTLRISTS